MARVKVNKKKTKTTKSNSASLWQLNVILLFLILQSGYLVYSNFESIGSFFKTDNVNHISDLLSGRNDSSDEVLESNDLRKDGNELSSSPAPKEKVVQQKGKSGSDIAKDGNSKGKKLARPVRLSILNGCRVSGIAGKWKRRLRKKKYDVRDTGNSKAVSRSTVISRISDMSYAYELADKLGISHKNVIQQINRSIVDVDVTLIIGKDYTRLKKDWK